MKINDAYALYIKDRSPEAKAVLGEALYPFIQAIIARVYGKQFHYLEDAVGDSAIKILTYIDKPGNNLNANNDIRNWVYTVVINTCLDKLRKRTQRRENAIVMDMAVVDHHSLFNKLAVRSALAKLTTEERIIAEQLAAGLTGDEAAAELEVGTSTMDRRRKEVKMKLRTLLGGEDKQCTFGDTIGM